MSLDNEKYALYLRPEDYNSVCKILPYIGDKPVVSVKLSNLAENKGVVCSTTDPLSSAGFIPIKLFVTAMLDDSRVLVPKSRDGIVKPFYVEYNSIKPLNGKPTSFDFQLICCADFIKNYVVSDSNILAKYIHYTHIKPIGGIPCGTPTEIHLFTYVRIDSGEFERLISRDKCEAIRVCEFPNFHLGFDERHFLNVLALEGEMNARPY